MTEKEIINRAMKDFRTTKAFAKSEGYNLNSIYYIGERLTKKQISIIKDLVCSFDALNNEVGKDIADIVVDRALKSAFVEMK